MTHLLKIAHRGYSSRYPENTILAFIKAIEWGADMIELDIRLSRDGHIVVIHDDSVDRTSDGKGMIEDLTLKELKALDFSCRWNGSFGKQEIPTLDEVIDIAKNRVMLNIEIKKSRTVCTEIEEALLDVLKRKGFVAPSLISSFDDDTLLRIRKRHPSIKTGMLYDNARPALREEVDLIRPYSLHPSIDAIDMNQLKWAKEKGLSVYPWVAETADLIQSLGATGLIDGVMVNELTLFSL